VRIVFHGEGAGAFTAGLSDLLQGAAEIAIFPDRLVSETDRRTYAAADVLVGFRFDDTLPRPEGLALLHVPGAGYDLIDLDAVPDAAVVCNRFGLTRRSRSM
jgi:hypothetical protein